MSPFLLRILMPMLGCLPGDSPDQLTQSWMNEVNTFYSSVHGDATVERKVHEISARYQKKASAFARGNDESGWRLLLDLDRQAGDEAAEASHCRAYLERFPHGAHRTDAAARIAMLDVRHAKGSDAIDRAVAEFATHYPDAVLELGELKVAAAELAIDALDVARARTLLDEAIALPKSKQEEELEKRNHGLAQHGWWSDRRAQLALFEKGTFDDFGGKDLDGKQVTVKDYRGKVLLIDFWATW